MLKENGRLTPAEEEEIANIKDKTFVCKACGESKVLSNVQFGTYVKCTKCGRLMIEQI